MTKALPAHRYQGAIVLVPTVMLLILVLMVTLYTGRVKTLQHKTLLNEQNYVLSFAAAESGLMKALGRLSEDSDWDGAQMNTILPENSSYSVTGIRQQVAKHSTTVTVVDLESVGTSADGLATTTIRESVLLYSVLANSPDAPLIVAGGMAVGGNFQVAANPNGGGAGVPVSVWTDQSIDMNNGSGTTCGLQEFNDNNCSTSPYSEKGFKNLDIVDEDPGFPDDLMEYLFNVPEAEWSQLRVDTDQIVADCSSLNAASVGLIWVDGNCTLNAGTVVGSTPAPVIVIVTDGDINMNGGAELFGILFSFRKPGVLTDFEIDMAGGAKVNGAVASNHPIGHANGTYNAVYDASVLASINQHDAFRRVGRIPGSWRDF